MLFNSGRRSLAGVGIGLAVVALVGWSTWAGVYLTLLDTRTPPTPNGMPAFVTITLATVFLCGVLTWMFAKIVAGQRAMVDRIARLEQAIQSSGDQRDERVPAQWSEAAQFAAAFRDASTAQIVYPPAIRAVIGRATVIPQPAPRSGSRRRHRGRPGGEGNGSKPDGAMVTLSTYMDDVHKAVGLGRQLAVEELRRGDPGCDA